MPMAATSMRIFRSIWRGVRSVTWSDVVAVLQFVLLIAVALGASGVFDLPRHVVAGCIAASACGAAYGVFERRILVSRGRKLFAGGISVLVVATAARLVPGPPPPPAPPAAPVELRYSATIEDVEFVWPQSSDDSNVEQYHLFCGTERIFAGRETTYHRKLPAGKINCRIIAVGAGGESPPTSVEFTVPRESTTLSPPAFLTATLVAAHSVEISWLPGTGPEPSGYSIFRDEKKIGESAVPRLIDNAVNPNMPYVYRVRAQRIAADGSGMVEESAPSDPLMLHTPAEQASTPNTPNSPVAPRDLIVVGRTQTSVTLRWTAPPNGSGLTYEIVRDGSYLGAVGATTYTDTGRKPSTSYRYQVRSAAAGRFSAFSTVTATTLASAEPARSTIQADVVPGYPADLDYNYNNKYDLLISDSHVLLKAEYGSNVYLLPGPAPLAYDTCQDAPIGPSVNLADLTLNRQLCVVTSEGRRAMLTVTKEFNETDQKLSFSGVIWD